MHSSTIFHFLVHFIFTRLDSQQINNLNRSKQKMQSFPGASEGKASACNVADPGSIPESRRSTGEGNGNPLQYSCLENSMDGGAWWAEVHEVTKSWTRLSDFTFKINADGDCSHEI